MDSSLIRLIVNADDLGNGPCRDRGIFAAFHAGIVTSASLLANGPTFVAAAREALRTGLPLGVHLNLSEGRALNGVIPGLTDATGNFIGKADVRQRLTTGDFDGVAVHRELLAQIDRVRDAGVNPDHLDTHQHCALFPSVTRLLLTVATETQLTALRRPIAAEPASMVALAGADAVTLSADLALYRTLAPGFAAKLDAGKFWSPEGLWGMTLLNRLNEDRLLEVLRGLPAGVWELMTHPGCSSPDEPFSGAERELELSALTSSRVRDVIARREIELTTFGACRCVC